MLQSLAHARAHLATPDVIFLPEQASVVVALAEFPALIESVSIVEGFDLSSFSPHLNPRSHVFPDDPALMLRSDPVKALLLDFRAGDPPGIGGCTCELVSTGGMVSGLAQWLYLRFADGITYENRPGSGPDLHWAVNLTPCRAQKSQPGDRYAAGSWYSGDTLISWCKPSSEDR